MRGSLSLQLQLEVHRLLKVFVWSVALYESESLTVQKQDVNPYEMWNMKFLITRISWID